jgi:hypothetical protein
VGSSRKPTLTLAHKVARVNYVLSRVVIVPEDIIPTKGLITLSIPPVLRPPVRNVDNSTAWMLMMGLTTSSLVGGPVLDNEQQQRNSKSFHRTRMR